MGSKGCSGEGGYGGMERGTEGHGGYKWGVELYVDSGGGVEGYAGSAEECKVLWVWHGGHGICIFNLEVFIKLGCSPY